jgi:hypothetical protein
MRAAVLLVAGIILLGAAAPLWAGPFTEVSADHWSYRACAHLAQLQVLTGEGTNAFSGNPTLTRFEFGLALVTPLSDAAAVLDALPRDANEAARLQAALVALHVKPRLSEREIAGALRELRRLASEYRDVLDSNSLNADRIGRELGQLAHEDGLRDWRLRELAATPALSALRAASGASPRDPTSVAVPIARGIVGLSLANPDQSPELLNYLAKSSAARQVLPETASGPAEPALSDPRISRLRTSYEYGLGSALTLSLAYEEIARTGQGKDALDAASLTSLGVGYQLTPSTSVRLSYSLLEYANYALDTPPLRDRLAETAVSIEF